MRSLLITLLGFAAAAEFAIAQEAQPPPGTERSAPAPACDGDCTSRLADRIRQVLAQDPVESEADDCRRAPLVVKKRVVPVYPQEAIRRGIRSGWVVVQFTVTTKGKTTDVVALSSSSSVFERFAVSAIEKTRYEPIVCDGVAVEVAGYTSRSNFALGN